MRRTIVGLLLLGVMTSTAAAQAPSSPPPPEAKAATAVAPAAAKATAKAGEKCMRLPLSDIAFGRDETIAQTRMRLGEYAEEERRKRGWGALTRSRETIECEVYLVLPVLGTEYKCLITATYCTK